VTAPAPSSRLATAALAYATRGWAICPLQEAPGGRCSCGNPNCPSPGKHPRTANGFHDASPNPETVRSWWARWPTANIGCKPGAAGLIVFDLDGPDGVRAAEAMGLLAEPTLEVVTGREDGGRHRYYRHPGGGPIANVVLAPKLDVRADHGYVLLPPSVHPTGRVYRWVGKLDEVTELPPAIASRLRGGTEGSSVARSVVDRLPAWMTPWLIAGEGNRNNTLTRFVGWAYSQGHDDPTVLSMAVGLNATYQPPLAREEVEAIVRSIGTREARKPRRTTNTGRVLSVANEPTPSPHPEPQQLAAEQVEAARVRGRLDLSNAPRWQWNALHDLAGPMIPGDLVVVGGLTGNGKTSLLLSQLDFLAEHGIATLYLPLEVDPADVRRRWAAWKLGLDYSLVARNEWHKLPEGSQEAHEAMLDEQGKNRWVQFPPDRRVTLGRLKHWMRWAVEKIDARVVFVDHFHRLEFGGGPGANYRVQVTETVRAMKDLAREFKVALVAAAQLNQAGDSDLDRYYPPVLKRLKESAGVGEEADTVLMLSRRLKQMLNPDQMRLIRAGLAAVRQYEEPGVLLVTCRKHRLDDSARDRSVRLRVDRGRVCDWESEWHQRAHPEVHRELCEGAEAE
jgi:KaiC/GvpD/RAD55 family RecA-like ATPase